MDVVTLSRATSADSATIERLAIAFKVSDPQPRSATELAALHGLLETASAGHAYLIEVHGQPIGYAVLCWGYSVEYQGRDAVLDEFYIEAAHRGRGTGARVLALLQAEARAAGAKAIHLEVRQDEIRAANLYRRAGWADRGSLWMSKSLT